MRLKTFEGLFLNKEWKERFVDIIKKKDRYWYLEIRI